MNYNNTVIKVLNKEHGKKVMDWWRNQGVNTEGYTGTLTEEDNHHAIYYGIINGKFNNCCIEDIIPYKLKVIELPNEYPKVMMVSDRPFSPINPGIRRVVFMEKNGKYLAWSCSRTLEEAKKNISTNAWKYAKDIEEEQIVELTIQDISDGKGVGIKPELIRIKK